MCSMLGMQTMSDVALEWLVSNKVFELEHHDPPGRDRDLPTGFRIAADALAFFAHDE
jgi:hypothetical protein